MEPDRVVVHVDRPAPLARRSPGAAPSSMAQTASAVLDLQRAAGNGATAGLLLQVQRQKGNAAGVAKYGSTKLTVRLRDMMQRGVLGVAGAPATLDRDQLFLLQGVANVETGGMDNAVYTRDNMYVSLGFKQVTLSWGSLYEIIRAAPAAFAKHGIVLGAGTYALKAGKLPAIEGAPDPVSLKTPPWTDRFFDAGAEDEVVSAMVAYTLSELGRMERRFAKDSPGRSNPWMKDPTARAWLLETMNNRPAYAYAAAKGTLRRTIGQELTREAFLAVLESEILGAYEARDERVKGEHIIGKIPRAVPSGGPAVAPAASRPTPVPTPAAGAKGADLVGQAASVLPPTRAATGGSGVVSAIGSAGLVLAALRLLVAAGHGDRNALTNIAFWAAHPELFGTKLQPSEPNFAQLSAEWIHLRDGIVQAAHSTSIRQAAPTTPPATRPAPGTVPADVVIAESPPPRVAGASQAGSGDKYFAQGVGRYRDVADTGQNAGKVRVWLYGSSGANVCNMTSLTMGLVSMAGEDEVRARMIGLLRSAGMHAGAQVQVGGTFVDLAAALDDPHTSARIRTLDLVTAVAIGRHGSYKSVTDAGTIARVARDAGIATKAQASTGRVQFTDPRVRAKAAEMLADGTRVILGTVNHYVFLTEVLGDGVVVHDPAGARVTPGLNGYLFVHAGDGAAIAAEFLKMDAGRQAAAVRRVTTNPEAAAVLNELPAIAGLGKRERAAEIQKLATAHPGHVETGRSNFYATSEFEENNLRLRVTLSAG
ncbi:hypothetical protein [Nakamurella sp.]|uniref:hypothetical protein n=1 Tax=Nakamurella sp. TaxID=1869182 RepID=UPI00378513ED